MSEPILSWANAAELGPARAGGKGWQLGVLAELGAPVPPGFVIDCEAFAGRQRGEPLSLELVSALTQALESRGWTDIPLAVRSSATQEDAAGASFAGIFRSLLNVRGHDALIEAVHAVLDSVHSPAAEAYQARLGISSLSGQMAVVVMPLLKAVASGVAFTCDPISGREDHCVIHANWGLGESLVGGQVDADEYRLEVLSLKDQLRLVQHRRGAKLQMTLSNAEQGTRLQETPPEVAADAVLRPLQAIALGQLVNELASALDYARPYIDFEWVWDGQRFWIVQARPITVRGRTTYPILMGQPSVWSRGNSRDVVPDPLPALDRSLTMPLVNYMVALNHRLAGHASLPGVQRTAIFHGRVYFETTIMQWEAFDTFDVAPKVYNRLLGGHQPEISVPQPKFWDRCRRAVHGGLYLLRTVWTRLAAKSTLETAHQAAAYLGYNVPSDASELIKLLHAAVNESRRADELMLLQSSGSALVVLQDLLEKYFPEEGSALTAALMSGGERSVTAAMSDALIELAGLAQAEASVLAFLRSTKRNAGNWRRELPADSAFTRAFEVFLQRFGHRAVFESYFQNPRWREDPSYLFDAVIGLIGFNATSIVERQRNNEAHAKRRIQARIPIWYRALIPSLVNFAVKERNNREGARSAFTALAGVVRQVVLALGKQWTERGELGAPEDVFQLTYGELVALAEGRLSGIHATKRVAWRRRQYREFCSQDPPELILEHERTKALAPNVVRSDHEWRGNVVASGYACGPAHVAEHPSAALDLTAGAILVVPATDPSWTPAFLKAAAIVMETGGYLSHGAIVAREFGIPAVVNLPGILRAVQSGELLEVDANRGVVRRRS